MEEVPFSDFYPKFIKKLEGESCPIKKEIHTQINTIRGAYGGWPEIIKQAIEKADLTSNSVPTNFADNLGKGKGHKDLAIALYYWLHTETTDFKYARNVDRVALNGETYEEVYGHSVKPVSVKPVTSGGERTEHKNNNPKGISIDVHLLRNHYKPWVHSNTVEDLVELTIDVVKEFNQDPKDDVKNTILSRAIEEGFFHTEQDKSWFEAGLIAGLIPSDEGAQLYGLDRDEYRRVFDDEWTLDSGLMAEILPNFEDKDFLYSKREKIHSTDKFSRQTKQLIDILIANINHQPVINGHTPLSPYIDHMLACNQTQITQSLLKLAKSKHYLLNGRSQFACPVLFDLIKSKNISNNKFLVDIHYNLINSSYPLRNTEHYGTRDVSCKLILSEKRGGEMPRTLAEGMKGFDAKELIKEFFEIYEIDIEAQTVSELQKFTDKHGSSGAKIIYFYHLEEMLISGEDKKTFQHHLNSILEMLKQLSGVPRKNDVGSYFIEDAWYPLVLLFAVCQSFDYGDLAEIVDKNLNSFEGWKNHNLLNNEVSKMRNNGGFLTAVHDVNLARKLIFEENIEKAEDKLNSGARAFKFLHHFPAVSKGAASAIKKFNIKLGNDGMDEVFTVSEPAVSHRNYIVKFSEM